MVYGDHVHQNPGNHLNGGVPANAKWQDYWKQLVVFPSQIYDALKGAVGTRFIEELAELILRILDRRINAEQFIVFQNGHTTEVTEGERSIPQKT
jgi:hypothetical protein